MTVIASIAMLKAVEIEAMKGPAIHEHLLPRSKSGGRIGVRRGVKWPRRTASTAVELGSCAQQWKR